MMILFQLWPESSKFRFPFRFPDNSFFSEASIHIHFPEGAVPKVGSFRVGACSIQSHVFSRVGFSRMVLVLESP